VKTETGDYVQFERRKSRNYFIYRKCMMAFIKRKVNILVTLCLVLCVVLFYNGHHNGDINLSDFETIQSLYQRTRQKSSQMLECQNPELDPFDPTLMKFYKKIPPLDCSKHQNWVEVSSDGSFVEVSRSAETQNGVISCSFRDVIRVTESTNKYSSYITSRKFAFTHSDFVAVNCSSERGGTWNNVVAGIRTKVDLTPPPPDYSSRKSPNIVVIGFDSISRNQYVRMLPLTYEVMSEEGAMVLESYNIVGDGTPAAVIPILTGKKEEELPEVRKTVKGSSFVGDVYPFIWKEFKKAGYVTLFGEDVPSVGTFTYRLTGFNEAPTDHYMQSFYREQKQEECFMGTPAHEVALQYCMKALRRYRDRPIFLYAFSGLLSHDNYNDIQKVDADLKKFILDMKKEQILNDTIFILFSDHGPRFSSGIRSTLQGKLEERMPMVSFLFPQWFKSENPDIHEAFLLNQHRLATPFDIHDTLMDVLRGTVSKPSDGSRSQSLFSPIPTSRSCTSASVEAHWCACQAWERLDTGDKLAKDAAKALVNTINNYTAQYRQYCQTFTLDSIDKALVAKAAKEVRQFVRKVVTHDGKQVLGFDTNGQEAKPETQIVQVTITAQPKQAKFEATVKFLGKNNSFLVKIEDVSRTNKYGDQPECIQNINLDLRKFCICKGKE